MTNSPSEPTGDSSAAPDQLGPMEGGQWRPVRPDELLLKNQPAEQAITPAAPKVTLERRQELEQHLKASPTDRDGYLELASIYRSEQRPLEAKRILEQGIKIFSDDEAMLWELEEATLARSLQQFREVSDLDRRLGTAESQRELKRSQHDWACRRMDVCRARLKRDPAKYQLRLALGEAMYDADLYKPALDELQQALKHDELACQSHLIRGRCLLSLGQDLQAMSELRAATMRRAVPAPVRTKVIGLRLLCEAAERMGVHLTLDRYRQQLQQAEQELADTASSGTSAAS